MADDLHAIVQRMIDAGESEDNIATVIQHFQQPAAAAPPPSGHSDATLTAASVPLAGRLVTELATNPGVPKAGSIVGQLAGGVEGALKGGPLSAAGGAWAGGKAGWFTGKLAQKLSAPVASAWESMAPYAAKVAPVVAAQGVNDLAQMAEPNRRDIGFLGIGASSPVPATDANGSGGHFGGTGTMSWGETAQAIRQYLMDKLHQQHQP